MEKKVISEIMEKYAAGELTMEEINEKLKELGAGYHLEPMTEEEARAKGEREIVGKQYVLKCIKNFFCG